MSGVYWGLTALYLLGHLEDMNEDEIVQWVLESQHDDGGFGGSPRHDSHMLYTCSAIQILALYKRLDLVNPERVISCKSMGHAQVNLVDISPLICLEHEAHMRAFADLH